MFNTMPEQHTSPIIQLLKYLLIIGALVYGAKKTFHGISGFINDNELSQTIIKNKTNTWNSVNDLANTSSKSPNKRPPSKKIPNGKTSRLKSR